jgi:hypothetical protein
MKKAILFLIVLIFLAFRLYAIQIDVGVSYGPRQINDSKIKDTYGNGFVFYPSFSLGLWRGIFVGIGYEGGYSKSGKIGIYNDPTTLKMSGIEFFLGYQRRIKSFVPFIKIGGGSFSYKQTFSSSYLKDFEVDNKKWAIIFSAGVRIIVFKGAYLSGEIKYIPLTVKPFEEEVDLGGMRFLVGIGYSI